MPAPLPRRAAKPKPRTRSAAGSRPNSPQRHRNSLHRPPMPHRPLPRSPHRPPPRSRRVRPLLQPRHALCPRVPRAATAVKARAHRRAVPRLRRVRVGVPHRATTRRTCPAKAAGRRKSIFRSRVRRRRPIVRPSSRPRVRMHAESRACAPPSPIWAKRKRRGRSSAAARLSARRSRPRRSHKKSASSSPSTMPSTRSSASAQWPR